MLIPMLKKQLKLYQNSFHHVIISIKYSTLDIIYWLAPIWYNLLINPLSFSEADPNPGPTHSVTQTCIYKHCDPKYSIWLKTKPLSVDHGPGPNGSATPADVYKSRAPKFPMFSKIKELTADKCPGPNAYDSGVPKSKVLKQSAAFTHRWQTANPLSNKDKNPGPAKYGLMTHNPFDKCPAFTMRRRYSEFVYVPIVPMDNCWCWLWCKWL